MAKKERGLGRGLDALLSTTNLMGLESPQIVNLEIEQLVPRQGQPRTRFDEDTLQELAESIKSQGLLQPLLVRPKGNQYEIIAGERRFRAARLAGLEMLPVVIKDIADHQAAEISLVENIQREDLNAVEEARAYRHLMDKYGYTQEKVAAIVGKSRAHVANTMRILSLPQEILQMIEAGQLTAGHARTLLTLPDARSQLLRAGEIIKNKLSVRQAEAKGRPGRKQGKKSAVAKPAKPAEIIDLEERLQQQFSTRVEIYPGPRGGKIQISYYGEDDLQRILELLGI
ncbi:MAG: ParB/RepB/Spo0J family partition protein [Syntrophomonadaceae bacterium]|nr:ParB/RepB/Spo0J family partition protein [Syntrophomonadaceae bacterium]